MNQKFELTLVTKPGCHLCDEARAVVESVLSDFDDRFTMVEKDILQDRELQGKYSEEIPVLLIGGKVHNYWRIDPERLRVALELLAIQ